VRVLGALDLVGASSKALVGKRVAYEAIGAVERGQALDAAVPFRVAPLQIVVGAVAVFGALPALLIRAMQRCGALGVYATTTCGAGTGLARRSSRSGTTHDAASSAG
jgi:hypothetical protein